MTRLRGLYAITPAYPGSAARTPGSPGAHTLAAQVEQVIAGGARMVQYREKSGDAVKRLHEARQLLRVCRNAKVPLIINDDPALAVRLGADGVHLGRTDMDPLEARSRLGPAKIIGVSCYNQFKRAVYAQEAGADYAAFGSFFPSATKPFAVRADADLLRRGRASLSIPLVAIGGITPENGRLLIAAGADMLAVVDAVFGQPNVRSAAAAFNALFVDGGSHK